MKDKKLRESWLLMGNVVLKLERSMAALKIAE